MKFLLVMEQDNGCDYTIGCGIALEEIEADNRKLAIAAAFEKMGVDYGDSPYISEDINRAGLYEICGEKITVPLDEYRLELARQEEDAKLAEKREAEQDQYLRLKAKYEGQR